jgi:hypothetical protein
VWKGGERRSIPFAVRYNGQRECSLQGRAEEESEDHSTDCDEEFSPAAEITKVTAKRKVQESSGSGIKFGSRIWGS